MEQIRITTEICIPNARQYVPLEQLAEYPFVKKPEEYIDGIITIDCGNQGNALDGCIEELWQCVLGALEQLCETDEAALCCPDHPHEGRMQRMPGRRMALQMDGQPELTADFAQLCGKLLDAAEEFFRSYPPSLAVVPFEAKEFFARIQRLRQCLINE